MPKKRSIKSREQDVDDEEIRKVEIEWQLHRLYQSIIQLVEAYSHAIMSEHMKHIHKSPLVSDFTMRHFKEYTEAKNELADVLEELKTILAER